ncbi:unnamed protein product [Closterium sp. NIES-53]
MFYFIVTRLPDSLRSVRDHFLSLYPTSLTVDLLEQHLLAAETSAVADVGAASASAKHRSSKGKDGRGGGGGSSGGGGGSGSGGGGNSGGSGGSGGGGGSGGSGGGGGGSGGSGGSGGGGTGGSRTGPWHGGPSGGQRQQQQRRSETQSPQQLHFDAIPSAMYALAVSAEGDCYRCVPPDPVIAAAALGASESGTLPGTAPSQALPTFTLADSSGGLVVARSSTVLPCPAVLSGSLSGLHLPSFSMNLVSTAALQDAMVTTTTPGGSSLYTLATEPPQVVASAQVSASGQVAASCSCRLLAHQTLLWHHRLGHPSLPCLRGMHSHLVVSGLPRSLPPLPPSPAPLCLPCVEGRQRAAPHSSSFPPMTAPLSASGSARTFLSCVCTLTEVCRIGLVMEVTRTSMIHAAAPHFLWVFVVWYAAHQLNLGPRVSLPETSPTLCWTGEVGDASDVKFDESVPFYRLFPYHSAPPPSPPLFLAPSPPAVDPLPPQGPAPSGVSQVDPLPRPAPIEVAVGSGAALGAASGDAASGGAEPGGAESEGAGSGGAEPRGEEPVGAEPAGVEPEGVEPGGAESEGAESGGAEPWGAASCGGPAGASPRLSPQLLRELFVRRTHRRSGATRTRGAGDAAAGGAGDTACPGGARTRVLELPGLVVLRALELDTLRSLELLELEALALVVLELQELELLTLELEVLETLCGHDRTLFPCFNKFLSGGLTECREPASRPVLPVRTAHRVPRSGPLRVPCTPAMALRPSSVPLRVRLPAPPESSLPEVPDPESDRARAASPIVSRLLATAITDPSFESATATALVAELLDFTAACRLDYATAHVAESMSPSPPYVRGECALGTDVLEDRQEDFECLAASAITGPYSSQWQAAMDAEMASWKSTGTYVVDGMWIFRVKRPPGSPPAFKAHYVARGFRQRQGVHYFHTFSPTPPSPFNVPSWYARHPPLPFTVPTWYASHPLPPFTSLSPLRSFPLLTSPHLPSPLHSSPPLPCLLNFFPFYQEPSLHEEIWLCRPPGFTKSFPARTQWSLWRLVYGLRQAPREWHDTLRTTLAALGFAPSTADPSLFLRTDTSLPSFYVLVYVDDLVFATADTEALTLVKSELQKRHTCIDLGELHSYLGLQITRDRARRTITLTQSHMVHQVLQCFGFQFSSPQPTPLSTSHSLSTPPSDESVEPSGPYIELVGCFMYLMTCTRPDLAYPLSLVARYVAPGRHRKVHWDAAKRVLRYFCSTSGMGLVLGGRGPVVLTGHADASWVDDSTTQQSSQGYTFSLGSGSVSWRSTHSSSVLSSICEAENYAGAMAAQELRWLTYLLTYLGEQPRSPPVLSVATFVLRTWPLGPTLLIYFTKALPPGDHQCLSTVLGLLALLFLTSLMTTCPVAAPCSCRLLSHLTLLWHHCLGHPSLPRLRGMHSRLLVSGLPRSLPPLPPLPTPPCLPCVEGRHRAAPHSSSFPPTTAPLQTLHMDVWGPARISGQDRERYFLLVVDGYTRYTTVFPLRSKGEVPDVLISWICAVCLLLRERSARTFLSFLCTLTEVQNGVAERRIGLVMEVARTSMIHAAAPHFLWPFAVWYAAHQLNLWPRVSLPETSPTLSWTGKVGDVLVFRVWGSRAFVRDTSADKLSSRAIPCIFFGFPLDTPGWQFYHPTSRHVLPSQDVTFGESVLFYHLFPYRTAPLPPLPPLFLAPGPPPVDPLPPQGPAPSGVSQIDPLPLAVPVKVAVDSGAARGAASGGAASGGAEPASAEPEGAEPGGTEPKGAEPGGAEPEGAESGGAEPRGTAFGGGPAGASPRLSHRQEPLSPQQLRKWFTQCTRVRSGTAEAGDSAAGGTGAGGAGATSPGGAGVTAGAGGTGGAGAAGPGGARNVGTGAAGVGGVGGAGAGDPGTGGTGAGGT